MGFSNNIFRESHARYILTGLLCYRDFMISTSETGQDIEIAEGIFDSLKDSRVFRYIAIFVVQL